MTEGDKAMSDLENFRAEARAWLAANCPPDMRAPIEREEDRCWDGRNWIFTSEGQRLWLQRMAARGWTAPEWPKAYGGGGLTREEHKILRQEMNAIDARPRPACSKSLDGARDGLALGERRRRTP